MEYIYICIYMCSVYSISIPWYIQPSTSVPWFVRRRWTPMPNLLDLITFPEIPRWVLKDFGRNVSRSPLKKAFTPQSFGRAWCRAWAMWKMWESIGKNVENVILRVATHLNLFEPIWELWIPQFIIIPYHISVCCLRPIFVSFALISLS